MSDFYIGYMPKAPDGLKKWIMISVVVLMSGGFLVLLIISPNYDKSVNSTFEYGITKELTGVIYRNPVPTIRVSSENSAKSLVLVNFGKSGVEEILDQLEESLDGELTEHLVTIQGSLIYYDGITLVEMSKGYQSIKNVEKVTTKTERSRSSLGEIKMQGELVDSKCFFGVMKPAFGKIHRSCAVRCISGGVPVAIASADHQYFFIEGKELLPYYELIGKPISISGTGYRLDDLSYLSIENIQLANNSSNLSDISVLIADVSQSIDNQVVYCQ